MQGVFTDGQHIFADATGAGCYRLAISRTLNPLGEGGVFGGGDRLGEQYLLSNPVSYPRLYTRPDGSRNIMLEFFQGGPAGVTAGARRYLCDAHPEVFGGLAGPRIQGIGGL
jgi:hypothetical protein